LARQRGEPLDAIAPPVEPAEEAHHDHLGVRADALDPQIDRHRMLEVAQLHGLAGPCRREAAEIAVGERQHRDVARRLAEVDGCDDVVERCGAGREQMHAYSSRLRPRSLSQKTYPKRPRVTAARSMPLSPITTSAPARGSPAFHGRS